jgi:tetratricopeptide (TPR) repeat protein
MTIVSILDKSAGFFSMFFFALNHLLYAEEHDLSFRLETTDWLFLSEKGWEDYFLPFARSGKNKDDNSRYVKHGDIIKEYFIEDYRYLIQDIYRYNERLSNSIKQYKDSLHLPEDYCSIFIRRGDKLINESIYYHARLYLDYLLKINPKCSAIYLQTDDYASYIELQEYMGQINLNIPIHTNCPPDFRGWFAKYDKEKVYDETSRMLIGIDLCLQSEYCVLDYQSNVSRFIKIAHKEPENVFDIQDTYFDWSKKKCLAYTESVYGFAYNKWTIATYYSLSC